tara:strand:+ start:457 stop:792 length:336 start_codon:yes stop_codon:yes gene_type:complete
VAVEAAMALPLLAARAVEAVHLVLRQIIPGLERVESVRLGKVLREAQGQVPTPLVVGLVAVVVLVGLALTVANLCEATVALVSNGPQVPATTTLEVGAVVGIITGRRLPEA